MDNLDRKLLNLAQGGLPLVPRPFAQMGEEIGLSEDEVILRLKKWHAQGLIRRLGGIFDSQALGFATTLVAMSVPQHMLDEVAQLINQYPQVTHNYEREGKYNLWFTITANQEAEIPDILGEIKEETNLELYSLPALRRFKIRAVFDLGEKYCESN